MDIPPASLDHSGVIGLRSIHSGASWSFSDHHPDLLDFFGAPLLRFWGILIQVFVFESLKIVLLFVGCASLWTSHIGIRSLQQQLRFRVLSWIIPPSFCQTEPDRLFLCQLVFSGATCTSVLRIQSPDARTLLLLHADHLRGFRTSLRFTLLSVHLPRLSPDLMALIT